MERLNGETKDTERTRGVTEVSNGDAERQQLGQECLVPGILGMLDGGIQRRR